MNMLTTTAEERESISDVCIVLLMAAVQREQILSCWTWLEKREAINSNNPLIVLHYSQRFAFSSSFSSSVFTSVFLLSSVSPSYFFHFSFSYLVDAQNASVGFLWSHISISESLLVPSLLCFFICFSVCLRCSFRPPAVVDSEKVYHCLNRVKIGCLSGATQLKAMNETTNHIMILRNVIFNEGLFYKWT